MTDEQPAKISYPIDVPVAENSRMTIVNRASEFEPGVEMRVFHKKKKLATEAVGIGWKDSQVAISPRWTE